MGLRHAVSDNAANPVAAILSTGVWGSAPFSQQITKKSPHRAMLLYASLASPCCWWGTVMPCCIGQNSVIIGYSKDPSGRKVVITQAFAFMTIFLHPGGQRPASIHVCGQMPLANCLWQMPLANAVLNTKRDGKFAPPAPEPNTEHSCSFAGPKLQMHFFCCASKPPQKSPVTRGPDCSFRSQK